MRYAYTILYVPDVEATLSFYEAALGLERAFLHESGDYGELASGAVRLGFASEALAAFNGFEIVPNRPAHKPAGWELGFVVEDVAVAYTQALAAGAMPVAEPSLKPWGQTVAYARDPNGCLIEFATAMD